MNVNSGGPHLLLFERDQQLTALLTSEFQLAGYECHAARTAVEVFDAIARYPIRLVLVNLAQAAAGRREFWVALDAQRRGRGVQVFTFRCMNLAAYGPDDPDDRARTVLADMEVDGMLGVMNLVDAVRARIPAPTTGSNPRLSATPGPSRQAGTREAAPVEAMNRAPGPQVVVTPAPSVTGQVTSAMPTLASNGISTPSAPSPQQPVSPPTRKPPQPSAPRLPVPQAGPPTSSLPASPTLAPSTSSPSPGPTAPPSSAGPGNTPSGFTDKIRAVMYPVPPQFPHTSIGQEPGEDQVNRQHPHNQPSTHPAGNETGLEQLSRMIREQTPPAQGEEAPPPSAMQDSPSGGQAAQRPADSPSTSALSLRASPIQDIAIEPVPSGLASGAANRHIVSREAEPSVEARLSAPTSRAPVNSLASLATDASPYTHSSEFVPPSTPVLPPIPVLATQVSPPDPPAISKPAPTQVPKPKSEQTPVSMPTPNAAPNEHESSSSLTKDVPSNEIASSTGPNAASSTETQRERVPATSQPSSMDQTEERTLDRTLLESPLADALKASVHSIIRRNEAATHASSDETLLNIVQSFPPISAPAQSPRQAQPPVLSGRATRPLGSVLLEGHLVPQHRLEVAQHIQRMLRGVDMHYQLGEILLMFKLLTPDQLLAASLVSYGLISTTQISALGRIRQELHAIGLEYDLESLLVLFRILSPEQLREVRASWSG